MRKGTERRACPSAANRPEEERSRNGQLAPHLGSPNSNLPATTDDEQRFFRYEGPAPFALEKVVQSAEGPGLGEAERAALREWADEYRDWKERQKAFDPVRARRERDASRNLALLAIGLPLYLFHWRIIRREAAAARTEGNGRSA